MDILRRQRSLAQPSSHGKYYKLNLHSIKESRVLIKPESCEAVRKKSTRKKKTKKTLHSRFSRSLLEHNVKLMWCSVTQSWLTLCDPMNWGPLGSSLHRIFQASILEKVAISYPRSSYLTQGLNPCLLHWQADSLPLSYVVSLKLI